MIKENFSSLSSKFFVYGQFRQEKIGLFFVIALFALLLCGTNTLRAQNTTLEYKGFKIDFAEISNSPQRQTILNSVRKQIDIVEQVGLGDKDIEFFKTVPITMLSDASGTPGEYKGKSVYLKAKDLAADKPILLHEFLHAYHNLMVPQGFKNERISQFYTNATKAFPNFKDEYFLKNDREFFAVTASIYLFGTITRPPYAQATIKTKLPNYYKFLETLFGARNN